MLLKTLSKSDIRFKRYSHFGCVQNNTIQRKLNSNICCIWKSILVSSDSFCLITSHMTICLTMKTCFFRHAKIREFHRLFYKLLFKNRYYRHRHVCTHFNAFFMRISNTVMKFHNFDDFGDIFLHCSLAQVCLKERVNVMVNNKLTCVHTLQDDNDLHMYVTCVKWIFFLNSKVSFLESMNERNREMNKIWKVMEKYTRGKNNMIKTGQRPREFCTWWNCLQYTMVFTKRTTNQDSFW